MPQSLTRMPKEAEITIAGGTIYIRDHLALLAGGLLGTTMDIITHPDSDRKSLEEFEKQGVSFEMAIEECVRELEEDTDVFAYLNMDHYSDTEYDDGDSEFVWEFFSDNAKSDTARKLANQLAEKIRSCNNWEDLYDELHMSSQFQQDMKSKIFEELERCP